ncbi:MAG TPA: SpoIVB peptidase S55 domain-containing protein [Terriglobales bacterium]|nr:SpoIVB peptidase S55 domain-containing protein [Terriglobales bacterium]
MTGLRGKFMWKVLSLAALCCLLSPLAVTAQTPTKAPETIAVSQIHAGMRGVAYTVFEGTKPEPMEVEVLGVMKNVNGPKGDVILVRLHGTKAEYTGVVAGMSGSPVYLDGKLAGALAFRIGEFSKEPIAGVTPIGEMLEISALDRTPGESAPVEAKAATGSTKTSGPGTPASLSNSSQGFTNYLRPIDTPLVFNGFSEETMRRYAPQFAAAGIVPVMGVGSHSDAKQPEPLEPGSAVSAVLVSGDMDIAATCTVTYVDPQRLLACGHPLLQFGSVDIPMTKAQVLATLPSPMNAFKIVNTTEPAGAFVQDRHTGILGEFNKKPDMIPVTLTIRSGSGTKEFHYEVLNNAKLSPVAMMATVFNALHGVNEYGEEITYRMNGSISVQGYPDVQLQNMFAPADSGQPAAALAAASLGDRFGRIYDNPYDVPDVEGVKLDFDLVKERRWARLESARTDVSDARPGDDIIVEAVLRPYRGERMVQQIPIHIPTSASRGPLRILVSDGETLDHMRRSAPMLGRKLGLGPTIALLNKEHANNRVYVSLLEADPEAMVADKVMPTLPLSVMNVMDGMRGTQEMVVLGESSVNEAATQPLDYAVAGGQILTISVK